MLYKNYRTLTLSQEQLRQLCTQYESGVHSRVLSGAFGITARNVLETLRVNGVRIRSQNERPDLHTVSEEVKQRVFELYRQGFRTREIAEQSGASRGYISTILRRDFDVPTRSSHKRQKLTPEQRVEIVAKYRAGATYVNLCKQYGVTSGVIASALKEHGVTPRTGWAAYRIVKWVDRKGRAFSFKSDWERAYAAYLDFKVLEWEYEPVRFELKICRRYTPDFRVSDSSGIRYVEIHGWADAPTERRLKEFVGLYPEVKLDILGPADLAVLGLVESYYIGHNQAKKVEAMRSRVLGARPLPNIEVDSPHRVC